MASGPGAARGGEEEGKRAVVSGDFKAFLGGLSWETTEEGLQMYFESLLDDPSQVLSTSINRDRFTGQPRGFGFVSFTNEEALVKVCEQVKHLIDGKDVEIKMAIRKERDPDSSAPLDRKVAPTTNADFLHPERKIFVGGLLPETREEDLHEHFSKFGPLVNAVIKYDPESKRSRGFGFITFETNEGIDAACDAGRHHQVLGKRVEIKRYQKAGQNSSAPGPGAAANNNGAASGASPTNAAAAADAAIKETLARPPKRFAKRTFEDVYGEYFEFETRKLAESRQRGSGQRAGYR